MKYEMKYKVGDKVVLKGTKEGLSASGWNVFFGKYGCKKGDMVVINEIRDRVFYYVKHPLKPNTSGFLTEDDLEPYTIVNWKQRMEKQNGKTNRS
jgi:hypothetical protein